mmetsp:Transcript_9735/g.31710  ORF Transcript_9735/g.31710 Transcript_9735/m.31710 type:complete len:439 (+) Transcript_9735:146-1462(+)|eukprot:CAMPEP_0118913188 /NCGR_PEP_ID=MMETSP1166-20130328/14113_1 /TAXON_ID=1104430 /ORGANISM="Chrysoreinhardia sp, Strain CCMP3193" /LENGTH=438 /DNA_ID=CAMNT_0006852737 /DNA_START=85 /DNA_END=1401 /DNA_ORIENTATION=-
MSSDVRCSVVLVAATALVWYALRRRKARRVDRIARTVLTYLDKVLEAFAKPYSGEADDDDEGFLLLAVAENKLTWPLLKPRLEAALSKPLPPWVANYGPMHGQPQCREVVERFFQTYVSSRKVPCFLLTGVAACLTHLFATILDEGDRVLVPAPYYAAFGYDLNALAGVQVVPCDLDNLERYAGEALLLTSPHNPSGEVYSSERLRKVAKFCEARKMHLVSDEIYALSTFRRTKTAPSFVSMLDVDDVAPERRHVVWGMSKDFGMSGLRVGVVFSENPTVQAALSSLANFSSVSGVVQHLLIDLLSDHTWCDAFLRANRTALDDAATLVETRLEELGLPFVRPDAGMFLLVDLSEFLPNFHADEDAVYRHLADHYKLVLTPGESMGCAKKGWFRICFAWLGSMDTLQVAMDRIAHFVNAQRQDAAKALVGAAAAVQKL